MSNDTKPKSLGEAIRAARERKGLTLRQLAESVDLSAPFLSDVEHGRRNTDKLPEIARVLGVGLPELEKLSLAYRLVNLDPRLREFLGSMHCTCCPLHGRRLR